MFFSFFSVFKCSFLLCVCLCLNRTVLLDWICGGLLWSPIILIELFQMANDERMPTKKRIRMNCGVRSVDKNQFAEINMSAHKMSGIFGCCVSLTVCTILKSVPVCDNWFSVVKSLLLCNSFCLFLRFLSVYCTPILDMLCLWLVACLLLMPLLLLCTHSPTHTQSH